MYTIIKCVDGKFRCQFRLQDSTEHYEEDTLKAAVKHAKKFAKNCNGVKIKKKDITFMQEQPTQEIKLIPWTPWS